MFCTIFFAILGTQQMNQNSFKTFKERGEWVELCFMTRALEHGYKISKPWGDSSPYDVGVSHGSDILRVQVKSTTVRTGTGYFCQFKLEALCGRERSESPQPKSRAKSRDLEKAGLHSPASGSLRRLHHSPGRLVSHPRRHPPRPPAQNRTHALPQGPAQKRPLQRSELIAWAGLHCIFESSAAGTECESPAR